MSFFDFEIADVSTLNKLQSIEANPQSAEYNSGSRYLTDNVFGINHRQTPLPVPQYKENYGLTFFTRPQLNLQSNNIRFNRLLIPLDTTIATSQERFIRTTLDPRLIHGYGAGDYDGADAVPTITCPIVDNEMAFIPILTNSLISLTGWPDIEVPTFTSREGQYKDSHTMVDGIAVNYSAYQLTANFRNQRGSPVLMLFYYWAHYMASVFEGRMVPYPDFIIENELDYTTRIYRLILGPNKRKVVGITACGVSIPAAVPMGQRYDFSMDKPYNDSNAEISIPFRATGFISEDDILVRAFNETVCMFKRSMRQGFRDSDMVKIPFDQLTVFNNRGYPRIDPTTKELQWWVDADYYNSRLALVEDFANTLYQEVGIL